jgi:death on curing protein
MDRVWLSKADVLALHEEVLTEFGGSNGVRDLGLRDSALAKPRHLAAYGNDPSLFELAAADCVGIAKNHPFVDGNKPLAFLAAAVFLELNGYVISPSEVEAVEKIVQVAQHKPNDKPDEAGLALWLKRHARRKQLRGGKP